MLTRWVRIQLATFMAIALVGVSYVGYRYAGLHRYFGTNSFVVVADLARAGGLFTNSEVTYRGVAVGRVGDMRLTDTGIEVDLTIDSSSPNIPANASAVVANRSAVGEQYIDLRPTSTDGPFLVGGSRIERSKTTIPLPVQDALSSLNALTTSVPPQALRTVVNELDRAFSGTGPHLQKILDTMSKFTRAAQQHWPETKALLENGRTVLDRQLAEAPAITSFSADLRAIAAQLKDSDGDLRRLVAEGPPAARQIGDLLRENGPNLGVTMANLITTNDVLVAKKDNIEHAMVAYPFLAAVLNSTVIPGDGFVHVVMNTSVPPWLPCEKGYEGTVRRGPTDTPAMANLNASCQEPLTSQVSARGAQHAPGAVKLPNPVQPVKNPLPGSDPAGQSAGLPGVLGLRGERSVTTLAQMLGMP